MRGTVRLRQTFVTSALIGLLLGGCSGTESPKSTVNLSVEFPETKNMGAQFIGLRTGYIVVTLKNLQTGQEFTAELDKNNPSHTFTNLDEGTYRVTTISYRKKTNKGYEGLVDYSVTTARFVGGSNSLSVSMPRAVWYFDKPITLNKTWIGSQEQVYGISLSPIDIERVFDEHSVHEAVLFGMNLDRCNGGGSTCVLDLEYSPAFTGPSTTNPRLGNELYINFYDQRYFAPLEPFGGTDRFMTLVSAPPCTYKKFTDKLISCEFKTDKDLSKYMGVKIDGSTMTGYLWEIKLVRQVPSIKTTCAWDIDMTDTFSCPANLFNPNPSRSSPSPSPNASPSDSPTNISAQQELIKNVSASLSMLFKESSKKYARCLDDQKTCDYNLNGEIGDPGDDTNKDGKIDASDARDFYYRYQWETEFDLYPHPFTAKAYQQFMKVNVPIMAGSFDTTSGLTDLKAVNYDGKLIKSFSPQGSSIVKAAMGWTFSKVDYKTKTFKDPFPRWVAGVLVDDNANKYKLFRIDLIKSKSATAQFGLLSSPFALPMDTLATDVPGSEQVCTFLAFFDPLRSSLYLFVLFGGQDNQCETTDDTLLFYDVKRHQFKDISKLNGVPVRYDLLANIKPYSDRDNEFISGFIMPIASNTYPFAFHCPINGFNCHDASLFYTSRVIECPPSRYGGHQLFNADPNINGYWGSAEIFDAWNDLFGSIQTISGGTTTSGAPPNIVDCLLTMWGVYYCVTTDAQTSPQNFTIWEVARGSSAGQFYFIARLSNPVPAGWDPATGNQLWLYSTRNRIILEFSTSPLIQYIYNPSQNTINKVTWPSNVTNIPKITHISPWGWVAKIGTAGYCWWSEWFTQNPYQTVCSDPTVNSNYFSPVTQSPSFPYVAVPLRTGNIDWFMSASCSYYGAMTNLAWRGFVQHNCTLSQGECYGGNMRMFDLELFELMPPSVFDVPLPSGALPEDAWMIDHFDPIGAVYFSKNSTRYLGIFSALHRYNQFTSTLDDPTWLIFGNRVETGGGGGFVP